MNSFVLNLVIAFTWLLLQERASFPTFVIGFLLGFALIRIFPGVLDSRDYTRKATALAVFAVIFAKQFVEACLQLLRIVLFVPARKLKPRVITYDISGLTRFEALLLSHCITLTPGSSAVGISDNLDTLILHVLDTDNPDALRDEIDRTLKRGILAITR